MDIKNKLIKTIEKSTNEKMLKHIYTNILGNTDILFQEYHEWFENKTEKEEDLELFILLQEDLFSDMLFEKGSITGDYMLRDGKHLIFETGLSIDEQYFRFIVEDIEKYDAFTDVNSRKIVVDKKHIKNKPTILHEMIHAHEFILEKRKPLLKEIVLLELYKDLKPKLNQKI